MKKSFVLYTDYINQISLLSMEQRGVLLTAALLYVAGENIPEMDGITSMAFAFIKAQLDRDLKKYDEISEKRKQAGKLGGRPKADASEEKQSKAKKANGFFEKQSKAKKPVNDNDTDNDTDTDNDIKKTIGAEPDKSAPTVITLTLNDGTAFPITQPMVDKWKELYPAVDIMQELRKMSGWLDANPTRRKTRTGVLRFVTAWLAKEQDKAPQRGAQRPRTTRFQNFEERQDDLDDLTAAMMRQRLSV